MMKQKSIQLVKYISWLPAVFIMAAIFWFSHQPADVSTEMSDQVTKALLGVAEMTGIMRFSPERVYELCVILSTPVRKAAHITEYTLLYLAVLFALKHWGFSGRKWLSRSFLITVLYACTDEFHQLFIPGRAGLATDVMIDSIGALVITAALWKAVERKTKK